MIHQFVVVKGQDPSKEENVWRYLVMAMGAEVPSQVAINLETLISFNCISGEYCRPKWPLTEWVCLLELHLLL